MKALSNKLPRWDVGNVPFPIGDYTDMIERKDGDYYRVEDVKSSVSEIEPLILKCKEIVDAWNSDGEFPPDSPLAKHPLTEEVERAYDELMRLKE